MLRIQFDAKNKSDDVHLADALKPKTEIRRGRKKITCDVLVQAVTSVHFNRGRTYRSLSRASVVPISTIHRARKRGDIERHSIAVKPAFTLENKVIPTIKDKLPCMKSRTMYIQQDNSNLHVPL